MNGPLYNNLVRMRGDDQPWDVLPSGDQLVLKATTQQLYLSRTDKVPTLPPVTVDLRSNLLGTWYFYQMKTNSGVIQYPQKRRQARWMRLDKGVLHHSGEGNTTPLRGRWVLNHDTLTFNDFNRPWKERWRISIDRDRTLYFHTLPNDTTPSEGVSFVRKPDFPGNF